VCRCCSRRQCRGDPGRGSWKLQPAFVCSHSNRRRRRAGLDGRDLSEALEGAVRSVIAATPVELDFVVRGERRPSKPVVETTAVRIGREAALNTLKHADARKIEVRLEYAPQRFVLEVTDDGRGIAPGTAEAAASDGHLGIAGMRARAGRAGGTMEITSRVGTGTTIRVTLPIA
jgi:signal transduction histidine kinase